MAYTAGLEPATFSFGGAQSIDSLLLEIKQLLRDLPNTSPLENSANLADQSRTIPDGSGSACYTGATQPALDSARVARKRKRKGATS